jgi:N-acetylmuramic acid 6-phosphate etherase
MVNVQPTNKKLEDRARRIIELAAAVTAERAAELLEESGRSVRTAIVMEKKKVSREAAEARLREAGGKIREALEK